MFTLRVLACVGMISAAVAPRTFASEWDQKTKLTVHERILIPGKVLEPGDYIMRLVDSPSNRHVVQFLTADEKEVLATVLARPTQRMTPANQQRFSFWEKPSDVPRAMRSWTYPGENFGHEFAYPREIAEQLARANQQPVPVAESTQVAEARPPQPPPEAPVAAPPPQPEPQPEPPQPAAQPEPPPPPPPQPEPPPMPATASYQPLLAIGGLISLAAAACLRLARRSS